MYGAAQRGLINLIVWCLVRRLFDGSSTFWLPPSPAAVGFHALLLFSPLSDTTTQNGNIYFYYGTPVHSYFQHCGRLAKKGFYSSRSCIYETDSTTTLLFYSISNPFTCAYLSNKVRQGHLPDYRRDQQPKPSYRKETDYQAYSCLLPLRLVVFIFSYSHRNDLRCSPFSPS